MIRLLAATTLAALFIASPALAVDPPVPAQAEQAVVKADAKDAKKSKDDEIVCVTEETTGSRVNAKRTCMSRAAYRQRTLDARAALGDMTKDRSLTSK